MTEKELTEETTCYSFSVCVVGCVVMLWGVGDNKIVSSRRVVSLCQGLSRRVKACPSVTEFVESCQCKLLFQS